MNDIVRGIVRQPGGSSLLVDNCRIGYFDYNDLATVSTPLVVTAVGSPIVIPNDAAGPQTYRADAPTGITDVWDEIADSFDWSELKAGDMVDIRLDLRVITVSVNTEVKVDLHLGDGAGIYTIPFVTETNFKTTGSHPINRYNGIYLANANTIDNGGQFKISTDKDCTVIVIGWYCKLLIRG